MMACCVVFFCEYDLNNLFGKAIYFCRYQFIVIVWHICGGETKTCCHVHEGYVT